MAAPKTKLTTEQYRKRFQRSTKIAPADLGFDLYGLNDLASKVRARATVAARGLFDLEAQPRGGIQAVTRKVGDAEVGFDDNGKPYGPRRKVSIYVTVYPEWGD